MEVLSCPRLVSNTDPFAAPHARWKLAVKTRNKQRLNRHADPCISMAVDHLNSQGQPPRFIPTLATAVAIYQADGLSRIEIEARVVVGQTDDEIALAMELAVDVVLWYRAMFFDVPSGATDYIMIRVVSDGDINDSSIRQLWIWMAMTFRKSDIQLLIENLRRAFHAGLKLSGCLRDEAILLDIKRFIADAVLPSTAAWQPWWQSLRTRQEAAHLLIDLAERTEAIVKLRNELVEMAAEVLLGRRDPPGHYQGQGHQIKSGLEDRCKKRSRSSGHHSPKQRWR